MKTEKELLELAAKAAGLPVEFNNCEFSGYFACGRDDEGDIDRWWNPLLNDGDALRLAVKLGLDVDCSWSNNVVVFSLRQELEARSEPWGKDRCVTTRRAIVLAAAAIGETI